MRHLPFHVANEVHCVVILPVYLIFHKMLFFLQALLLADPAVFLCLNGNLSEWILDYGESQRYLLINHPRKKPSQTRLLRTLHRHTAHFLHR